MKSVGLLISTMNSGGAERVVSHLTRILGQDYDVHLILFEDTYMEYECAGTLHSLDVPATPGGPLTKLTLLRKRIARLKALIRREKLECVISFVTSPNVVNLLAGVPGCRKVISIRNYSNDVSALKDRLFRALYRRADCIVPVSKIIARQFHTRYGIPTQKLRPIYNPYDFRLMEEKGKEPLSQEEEIFYRDRFVFANVGRIMHQKGVWHLLKAFDAVHKEHPQAGLVIVGEDFTKGKLPALIEKLGLADSVLLTGRSRNPYQYLYHADCYVLSSLFEGFPNALVEAMACNCAVIATDCKSGPREILYETPDLADCATGVTEADYGILVPPLEDEEDWEAVALTPGEEQLSRAMAGVLEDPQKCQDLAQKAKKRSFAFDFEAARRAYSAVIQGE